MSISRDDACTVIDYIEALEERVRHDSIMDKLASDGYSAEEIDRALKALGKIAGRTCGIL